ncbi:hypothetical protein KQI88_05730 [Alkaliphilus sp. MSJ-5]|uniref:Uncharacterized protein n=1 Tax=Alkaliphilus flagellatus TaxID=2841507 RepID=A0ABS6G088_9FIRM|nr:hypothetical protein [Alkaliphilus flagellatus]MBU5675908.1 hypothetical protein [Alkaliphilus flagellatus]
MNNIDYYQMMGYPTCSPIAECTTESLESMYPEIYHRVYPKVMHMCMMMDHPNNPEMYPCPRRETVERMADDIYMQTMMEMGGEWEDWQPMSQQFPEFGRDRFGRRPFLRDLIFILLIRQLLRRRGRIF